MIDYKDDSERAVLSICMNYPERTVEILDTTYPEYFHGKNLAVYTTMQEVVKDQGTTDLVTIVSKMPGMSGDLSELSSVYAAAKTAEYHIAQLDDRHKRYELWKISGAIRELAENTSAEILSSELEKALTNLHNRKQGQYLNAGQFARVIVDYLEAAYHGRIEEGIQTGLVDVDYKLIGLRKQELIIVGARPSIGKTAFMLTLAVNMIRKGHRVGIFSAEMSSLQLGKRVLAIGSGENIRTIDAGGGKHFGSLFNTIVEIGDGGKIFVNDQPNILLEDLVRNARAMKRKEAVEIIFVDYLSLIRHSNQKLPLWERIGDITQKLKELSRELDIPVVVLSQVTRDTEGKEPSLATLRYSGSVEQDADVIMFLHREREDAEVNQTLPTQVIIAKNRNGETGRAEVMFIPSQTKFANAGRL